MPLPPGKGSRTFPVGWGTEEESVEGNPGSHMRSVQRLQVGTPAPPRLSFLRVTIPRLCWGPCPWFRCWHGGTQMLPYSRIRSANSRDARTRNISKDPRTCFNMKYANIGTV